MGERREMNKTVDEEGKLSCNALGLTKELTRQRGIPTYLFRHFLAAFDLLSHDVSGLSDFQRHLLQVSILPFHRFQLPHGLVQTPLQIVPANAAPTGVRQIAASGAVGRPDGVAVITAGATAAHGTTFVGGVKEERGDVEEDEEPN